jgi:hypothetical protein
MIENLSPIDFGFWVRAVHKCSKSLGDACAHARNWGTTCSHKRFSEIISAYNRVFSFDAFYTMRGESVFIEFY